MRAPRADEAQAVLDVIVASDVAYIGRADYTLQDVLDDWARPDLDRERDVFVVEDEAGTLIAAKSAPEFRLALDDEQGSSGRRSVSAGRTTSATWPSSPSPLVAVAAATGGRFCWRCWTPSAPPR